VRAAASSTRADAAATLSGPAAAVARVKARHSCRSALTGSPAARKGGPLSAVEENLYGSKAVPD
jgi:hypothetical protein